MDVGHMAPLQQISNEIAVSFCSHHIVRSGWQRFNYGATFESIDHSIWRSVIFQLKIKLSTIIIQNKCIIRLPVDHFNGERNRFQYQSILKRILIIRFWFGKFPLAGQKRTITTCDLSIRPNSDYFQHILVPFDIHLVWLVHRPRLI